MSIKELPVNYIISARNEQDLHNDNLLIPWFDLKRHIDQLFSRKGCSCSRYRAGKEMGRYTERFILYVIIASSH